jgi:hypothetical protein
MTLTKGLTNFIHSIDMTLLRASSVCAAALLLSAVGVFAENNKPGSELRLIQTIDEYMALRPPTERSPKESSDAAALATNINSFERTALEAVLLNRIAAARSGKDLLKFRFLLERITPSLQEKFLARAGSEVLPRQKRNFLRLGDVFWSREVVRFLVNQLEDKRPADTEGDPSPRAVRICDYALNVLNDHLKAALDLKVGIGPGGGDAIVADVPIPRRDEWIEMFRKALANKYGANLELFDQQGR